MPKKLFAAFQKEVGDNFNVAEILSGWISQSGYPILNINVTIDRQYVMITQKRFLQKNPNHQDKTVWKVPITYANNHENTDFMNTKPLNMLSDKCLKIKLKRPIDWIIFNVQQSGKTL